eukprot:TRINITY_DN47933_c0_g1_i1.p1 TRINITY_DN47933_c0_g1~~TRINITY_DN47933_c0_g1_i1.p1  ORF type:complete len:119 (-),score=16.81 TRINITY_DN47933_c0_g1_i1:9-365(-)
MSFLSSKAAEWPLHNSIDLVVLLVTRVGIILICIGGVLHPFGTCGFFLLIILDDKLHPVVEAEYADNDNYDGDRCSKPNGCVVRCHCCFLLDSLCFLAAASKAAVNGKLGFRRLETCK